MVCEDAVKYVYMRSIKELTHNIDEHERGYIINVIISDLLVWNNVDLNMNHDDLSSVHPTHLQYWGEIGKNKITMLSQFR